MTAYDKELLAKFATSSMRDLSAMERAHVQERFPAVFAARVQIEAVAAQMRHDAEIDRLRDEFDNWRDMVVEQ